MEELFQYMKTFRTQINDAADQAAKISVEEQMQCTTLETLQKDLDLVKDKTRQIKEETDHMTKAKGQICLQIMDKQRKMASLESETSNLSQSIEFMQQEKLYLSEKLVDRSTYYKKVDEEISRQLKQQQEQVNVQKFSSQIRESSVNDKACETKEFHDHVDESLMMNFQDVQSKCDTMEQLKSNLILENTKLRQAVQLVKNKINDFKPELREMDEKSLEEELQALLSDKNGETEYVQSLQLQIMRLKGISHTVTCSCGEEFDVKLDTFA